MLPHVPVPRLPLLKTFGAGAERMIFFQCLQTTEVKSWEVAIMLDNEFGPVSGESDNRLCKATFLLP